MDDYAYEIHIPDSKGNFIVGETKTTQAYDEPEAHTKASNYASYKYVTWRIRNTRLIKRYINPDGEI